MYTFWFDFETKTFILDIPVGLMECLSTLLMDQSMKILPSPVSGTNPGQGNQWTLANVTCGLKLEFVFNY